MGAVVVGRVGRSMGITIVYAGRLIPKEPIAAHLAAGGERFEVNLRCRQRSARGCAAVGSRRKAAALGERCTPYSRGGR